jgi:hypothetical protein
MYYIVEERKRVAKKLRGSTIIRSTICARIAKMFLDPTVNWFGRRSRYVPKSILRRHSADFQDEK